MSKIGILYTGGTIGCTGIPLTPLNEKDFSTAFIHIVEPIVQSTYSDCTINFIPFGTVLDSTDLQPSDWCKMANDILSHYALYDAFIVLHGTDTMAWTASALSFLLTGFDNNGKINARLSKPVIVTGAVLPLFCEDSSTLSIRHNTDAFQNICGAVVAACTDIPEVCLYFDNKLFRGNRAVKTNASEFNAFSTPNYPMLGEFDGLEFFLRNDYISPWLTIPNISIDNEPAESLLKKQLAYITDHINKTVVIPILSFPAYYNDRSNPNTSVFSQMLSACIEQGVHGMILKSYGNGNFPSGNPTMPSKGAIYQTLKTASDNGVIIINCTQVLTGIVNSNTYASGSWLIDVGAVNALDMTSISAFVKLIYLYTLKDYNQNKWDQTTIKRLMISHFVGEILDGI